MSISNFVSYLKWRFIRCFCNEATNAWFKAMRYNKQFREGEIVSLDEYSFGVPIINCNKRAICIYDGKINIGGLADRLRGIISIYEVCKELNIEFKIRFIAPFNLTEFLIPNKINWQIENSELNYNKHITNVCCIATFSGSSHESEKQKQWFRKEFNKKYKEFHVRTNAIFSYGGNYSALFNELFKPSPRLLSSIEKQKALLGTNYISTSFRFMNLLNDFNETVELHSKLTKEEQNELIVKNIEQLQILHSKYPGKRILVNSDSTTFLQTAAKLDYVYTIPGNITHIDSKNNNDEYETYEKTFLDFFMIANAEKIYLLRTGQMYNSGYPFAASKVYNKPFEKIEF